MKTTIKCYLYQPFCDFTSLVASFVWLVRDCKSAFCEGNSAIKSRVWAHPAYLPYFSTNASATRLQSLGVNFVPASSGIKYLVAIFFYIKTKNHQYFSNYVSCNKPCYKEDMNEAGWPSRHVYQQEQHGVDLKRTKQCKQQLWGPHQVE